VINWILQNREWLFSGLGLALAGLIFAVVRAGYSRWREVRDAKSGDESQSVLYAPAVPRQMRVRLPAFLLRAFLKPDSVRSRVRIGLREESPIHLWLGAQLPHIDLYFQVTNLSSLDLVLDRLLVDVWFSQPTFTGALLRRQFVPAGEITKGIHFRQFLADNQKRHIEEFNSRPQGTAGSINIYLTAYFESNVGRLIVDRSIELPKL
jgi:hypothetical protein